LRNPTLIKRFAQQDGLSRRLPARHTAITAERMERELQARYRNPEVAPDRRVSRSMASRSPNGLRVSPSSRKPPTPHPSASSNTPQQTTAPGRHELFADLADQAGSTDPRSLAQQLVCSNDCGRDITPG